MGHGTEKSRESAYFQEWLDPGAQTMASVFDFFFPAGFPPPRCGYSQASFLCLLAKWFLVCAQTGNRSGDLEVQGPRLNKLSHSHYGNHYFIYRTSYL